MGLVRILLCLLLPLCLAACGGGPRYSTDVFPAGGSSECVPFARAVSGIALSGDAYTWWDQAAGRYQRSRTPDVGAVLVFARTSRLPEGHVSVVSQLLSQRRIEVTQANWVHARITRDQVLDISPLNDWSLVRVWWQPAGQLGATAYPVSGFIKR